MVKNIKVLMWEILTLIKENDKLFIYIMNNKWC